MGNCSCGNKSNLDDSFFFFQKSINDHEKCCKDCGVINQEIRIVGGLPTGVNRYPWVARLVYDGKFHCGASLISNDYVLTAAHCVRR